MKCKECGSPISEGIKFCENCGNPVDLQVDEDSHSGGEFLEEQDLDEDNLVEEPQVLAPVEEDSQEDLGIGQIEDYSHSDSIVESQEGVYHWHYEYSLWRNSSYLSAIILGLLLLVSIPALVMFFVNMGQGLEEAGKLALKILAYNAATGLILFILGYTIYKKRFGSKYYLIFTMDKDGVNRIQLDQEVKKKDIDELFSSFLGLYSGEFGQVKELIQSFRQGDYSDFKKVKTIKALERKQTLLIGLNHGKNTIYSPKDDYNFVRAHILKHSPRTAVLTDKSLNKKL